MVNRAHLLERLLDSQAGPLSAELARYILTLHFPATDHSRCADLSAKAQDGKLTPEETAELDEYLAASDVLAILQSKARKSLQSRTPAA
jgi:hypothetical protein